MLPGPGLLPFIPCFLAFQPSWPFIPIDQGLYSQKPQKAHSHAFSIPSVPTALIIKKPLIKGVSEPKLLTGQGDYEYINKLILFILRKLFYAYSTDIIFIRKDVRVSYLFFVICFITYFTFNIVILLLFTFTTKITDV